MDQTLKHLVHGIPTAEVEEVDWRPYLRFG
jgi:hypothetical protein